METEIKKKIQNSVGVILLPICQQEEKKTGLFKTMSSFFEVEIFIIFKTICPQTTEELQFPLKINLVQEVCGWAH